MARVALLLGALALVLGIGVELADSSQATILIKKNLGQLAAESELIVVGRVTAKTSNWHDGLILTHHTFEVERCLKGKATGQLVVTEIGGTVGDMTMRVESAPTYAVGQRVVLTLKKDVKGFLRTHGWIQGRFFVARNPATELDMVRLDPGLAHVTSSWFGPRARTCELEDFCDTLTELVALAKKKEEALRAKQGRKTEEGR